MSRVVGHWRPVLRMARRDLRRHPVRALLTCLLVALPMVAATVAALASANSDYTRDVEATEQMRQADGIAVVSSWTRLDRREALWLSTSDTGGPAQRRDPASVDLGTLLPPGSSITPFPVQRDIGLPSGGRAFVEFADLEDPLFAGGPELSTGRAPSAPDEVAISETAADELGLLTTDGSPADGAVLEVTNGPALSVVGTVSASGSAFYGPSLVLVAAPDSRLAPSDPKRPRYLVELPSLPRSELKDLQASLAGSGVAFSPRDHVLHPGVWSSRYHGGPETPDLTHLVVGALVMLVGMLEVVLLVGAAFAIAARRQVRDLGLLAANGGARADLRRALLAQGLVLGGVSSLVGVGLGVVAFLEGVPLWERLLDRTMYRTEVDVPTLVVVALLGIVTAVVAAMLPAWSTARLSPVAALSGRFPVRPGESRAHRGAFVLLGGGLLLTLVGGFFTARSFAPRAQESPLPPFVAGLGLLLMVAGAIWATPYVVRVVAGAGKGLPLAGRYAFRDAGRHRFRSAAAVMALTITVAGAVLSGFAFSSVAASQEELGGYQPPNSLVLYGSDAAAAARTVEEVYGPVEAVRTRSFQLPRSEEAKGRGVHDRSVLVRGAPRSLEIVDTDSLAVMVTPGTREAALATLEGGGVVVLSGTGVPDRDVAELRTRSRMAVPLTVDRLPQTTVDSALSTDSDGDLLGTSFVSAATAERLAGRPLADRGGFDQTLLVGSEPFTTDVLDRLEVYGIYGETSDPERLRAEQAQYLGLVVAGLLSALVVGIAVAMASAESRDDVATLAAVGAGPWRRRSLGAMHGLFLGIVGCVLGLAVGVPSGLAFTQVDGLPGFDVPWVSSLGTVASVLVLGLVAGWLVTPSRLRLTRRTT